MNTTLPSGPALAVLAVLALVQLGLLVAGLVTWLRTPAQRVTGNRYAWLVLVLVVGIVGPLAFLLAGRRPAPAADPLGSRPAGAAGTTGTARVTGAVDELYGSGDR